MTNGQSPVLQNWRIIEVDGRDQHLVGRVYGHPLLRDGARAITSPVIWIDEAAGAARTQNRHYHLGQKGSGPLPPDWAERIDEWLAFAWGAQRAGWR